MIWHEKVVVGLSILAVIGFVSMFTITWNNQSDYHDMYKATVPFGEFINTGELGGAMFFGFGSISGSFSGDEYYLVKYFDDEELKPLKLDAEDTPLIVDGTFQLEIIYRYPTTRWFFIFPTAYFCHVILWVR